MFDAIYKKSEISVQILSIDVWNKFIMEDID